jgi:hypothetical protein
MKSESSAHLSEEALDDVLIGLSSPESEAHLAVCSVCRGQLEDFQSRVQVFNQTSLAWSESKPAVSLRPKVEARARRQRFIPLELAMAATLLLVIGVPVWNREHNQISDQPVQHVAQSAAPGDSEAQIAQDNDLLRSVDAALSTSDESPISEYHLAVKSHSHMKARQ